MKTFELSVGNKAYKVDIEKFDGKRALVRVDGKPYEVDVKKTAGTPSRRSPGSTPPTTIREKAPPAAPEPPIAPVPSAPSGGEVTAPMPGLILDIMVAAGDHVAAGTPVIKMEAMKMENMIPSPVNGTVKTIAVKVGDNVATDETLMVIEKA
ncbi:MAG: acetyl-CoA carboxylase biotin carboxyl carrier protein subunit [Deltaproteobacteria bacterium]|nr:acetyl-CoA carboxylase biotin carboxyl carrier protein subunit [Deltaproteobacteria bacterium]MBW2073424.1 acetyl-CoA carboxylase biotin carboxyl carrier protein subunit [Deltaproteobacteria bacterium]RLB83981.1 MAG: acetyl-CoA carboxylase biotin carboxyl carrier protein subunit [Deltaproteobacteria bacterium]